MARPTRRDTMIKNLMKYRDSKKKENRIEDENKEPPKQEDVMTLWDMLNKKKKV